MADQPTAMRYRRGRGLIAFMDEPEALAMMQGGPASSTSLSGGFHETYTRAISLLRSSGPSTSDPSLRNIDPSHQTYLYQISSTPSFTRAFHGQTWDFKEIEIDKLVCFQKYIDVDYVTELSAGLLSSPDESEVLRFCFPTAFQVPASVNVDPVSQAITVTSHLPNIQLTNFGLSQPGTGAPTSAIFTFGANANYVQVVKYQNRYILKNGYHRVYTLRQKGFTETPCVYAETSNFDQTGANRPGFFPREILLSQRPPVFADFFDEALSSEVRIQPMLHVLKMRAERFDVPLPIPNVIEASHEVGPK